jgi:hypothetical protein
MTEVLLMVTSLLNTGTVSTVAGTDATEAKGYNQIYSHRYLQIEIKSLLIEGAILTRTVGVAKEIRACIRPVPVLWIRIHKDSKLFAGSRSETRGN